MTLEFAQPLYLLLLPLAAIPWWRTGRQAVDCAYDPLLPDDRLSTWLHRLEKLLLSAALLTLALAAAGPFRPDQTVERIGRGAQMVVLLDRSRSMDQPFDDGQPRVYQPALASRPGATKGEVARRLLSEFAARRRADMFGMVIFSTNPIQVLPLTQKPEMIQSAIRAGNVGRGLAETDVGAGLKTALQFFEGRPYTGSRIVLFISDGAATLDLLTREQIRQLTGELRVALYWLYLRTRNSPGIFDRPRNEDEERQRYPQRSLHEFFSSLDTPYRVYTAQDPEALERAIADVSTLQNLPLHYRETIHRVDLHRWFYGAAALLLVPLLGVRVVTARAAI